MRRMKVCLLTLAFAGAVSTAWAGDETWQLESVHGKIGFHPELMRDLGISAQPSVGADSYYRIVTPFEASGRLELRAPGSVFRDVGDGELHVTSTGTLRLRDTEIPLQGLTGEPARTEVITQQPVVLEIFSSLPPLGTAGPTRLVNQE